MQYNLVRNGYFASSTVSGTGDVSLTWPQLESLMDGNLTSSGVSITSSGILYLQVDLSQRVKIDDIKLYAGDLTKSANIKFYYKDEVGDSYTELATYSGSYYYAEIPGISAPRFVQVTVSGADIDLYELVIYNDDYIVAFGTDGQMYADYMNDSPIGREGDPQAVPIYNNDTTGPPVTGYATVDYTGTDADNYMKISTSENGTYYGVSDGVLLEDNGLNSTYIWDMGQYDNTIIVGNKLILDTPTISGGTYTSPIFKKDDGYSSSYFVIDVDTVSGTTSVSYDENSYNGTIRVRSDDTEPIILNEVYWNVSKTGGNDMYVYKYNLDTGDGGDWVGLISSDIFSDTSGTAVNRRTGHVAMSHDRYEIGKSGDDSSYIYIYDRDGSVLYSKSGSYYRYYSFNVNMEFDINGGIWGYGTDADYLIHFDNQLTSTIYSESGVDYIYDFAVELNGDGIWYTDESTDFVVHLDTSGNTIGQISLDTPRAICGTNDNGCWVIDNGDKYARRYGYNSGFAQSVYLDRTAVCMAADYEDGFWYATPSYVYHVNSGGVEVSSTAISSSSRLKPMQGGCVSWCQSTYQVRYINSDGALVRTINAPSSDNGFPAVFSHSYNDFVSYNTFDLPADNDPVWGVNGSLEWKEVRKDGYFLYKKQYHQVELTLRSDQEGVYPYVNKVIMSPAIQVQDIPSQSYKNVYVKTDIPAAADPVDHEARLKVWWGEEV